MVRQSDRSVVNRCVAPQGTVVRPGGWTASVEGARACSTRERGAETKRVNSCAASRRVRRMRTDSQRPLHHARGNDTSPVDRRCPASIQRDSTSLVHSELRRCFRHVYAQSRSTRVLIHVPRCVRGGVAIPRRARQPFGPRNRPNPPRRIVPNHAVDLTSGALLTMETMRTTISDRCEHASIFQIAGMICACRGRPPSLRLRRLRLNIHPRPEP
jgi:hypothetical protein